MPKVGGIKKGWQEVYLRLADGILAVHSLYSQLRRDRMLPAALQSLDPGNPLAEPKPQVVIDLRTAHVRVGPADESEVIHAAKRDVPCIFRLQAEISGHTTTLTLMAEDSRSRTRWIERFRGASAAAAHSGLPPGDTGFTVGTHISSLQVPEVKDATCAALVDEATLLMGAPAGLFLVRCRNGDAVPLGDTKKMVNVTQVSALPAFNFAAVVYGKTPQVRIFDLKAAVRRGDEGVKVPESKGCSALAVGVIKDNAALAVLVRRTVFLCPVDATGRVQPSRSLELDQPASSLNFAADALVVGMANSFTLFDAERLRGQALVSSHEATLDFARPPLSVEHDLRPAAAFEVSRSESGVVELLLCFDSVAFFVNQAGMPMRNGLLLKWRCEAHAFLLLDEGSTLAVMGLSHIELLDLTTGALVQAVALPRVQAASDHEPMFFTKSPGGVQSLVQLWPAHAPSPVVESGDSAVATGSSNTSRNGDLTATAAGLAAPLPSVAAGAIGTGAGAGSAATVIESSGRSDTRGSSSSMLSEKGRSGTGIRRFTFGSRRSSKGNPAADRLPSRQISQPSGFQHVEHMGPRGSLSSGADGNSSSAAAPAALAGMMQRTAGSLTALPGAVGSAVPAHAIGVRPRGATMSASVSASTLASSVSPSGSPRARGSLKGRGSPQLRNSTAVSLAGQSQDGSPVQTPRPSASSAAAVIASAAAAESLPDPVLRSRAAQVRASRTEDKVESLGFSAMLANPNTRFSDLYHMIAGVGGGAAGEDGDEDAEGGEAERGNADGHDVDRLVAAERKQADAPVSASPAETSAHRQSPSSSTLEASAASPSPTRAQGRPVPGTSGSPSPGRRSARKPARQSSTRKHLSEVL